MVVKKRTTPTIEPELVRQAEARVRAEAGIERLADDEELIDDATFARLHARFAMGSAGADAEGECAAAGGDSIDDELLLEEIATELPAPRNRVTGQAEARPPADAAEVASLEAGLLAAKNRDEVAVLSLRIARHHARAAALFVVNRDWIAGLRGAGGGIEARLDGIMIPVGTDSLLAQAVEAGRIVRAGLPFGAVDQRLLRALGRVEASEIAVLPIAIGERVVNLLYADNGAARLAETGLAALRVLCLGVGRVYERLIRERKREAGAGGA